MNIDLSITCDTEYYNGLVFKGYVPGAPSAVLSGGRYDSLMRGLGKEEQAMAAVYLNLLERLGGPEPEYDADVLLIPDGETPGSWPARCGADGLGQERPGAAGRLFRPALPGGDENAGQGRPVELKRND